MNANGSEETQPPLRARVLQAVWWLVVLGSLGLFVILIPINIRATSVSIEVEQVMNLLHPYVSVRGFSIYLVTLRYLAAAAFFTAGAVIYWRCRDEWAAVLFSILLFLLPANFNLGANIEIISPTDPRGSVLSIASGGLAVLSWVCILLLLFVFPDGRFVPGWTRKAAFYGIPAAIAVAGTLLLWPGLEWSTVFTGLVIDGLGILMLLATGVGSQIYRYRSASSPLQKQQTKLVLIGLLIYLQWAVGPWWYVQQSEAPLLVLLRTHLDILFPLLLPLAVAVSILRFRLWDIEVIIRRTLIYSALTAVLALIYLFNVVLLQRVFSTQSQLTTVISTLAVAALFSPLRRWIQGLIDRRFYRQKYDAHLVLQEFSATLRLQVDLEPLEKSILSAIEASLRPAGVWMWVRDASLEHSSQASSPQPGQPSTEPAATQARVPPHSE